MRAKTIVWSGAEASWGAFVTALSPVVRAQDLLPLSPWHPASVELVQYLLLTSQYLQSTNHPHQTWMVVGSAIRTAQSVGLHLVETSAAQELEDRELLRRIWYGCVLMDRYVDHYRSSAVVGVRGSLFD